MTAPTRTGCTALTGRAEEPQHLRCHSAMSIPWRWPSDKALMDVRKDHVEMPARRGQTGHWVIP